MISMLDLFLFFCSASRSVQLGLLFICFLFIVPEVQARSPDLHNFRQEVSKDSLSCIDEFLSISLSGHGPESLVNHSLKAWNRASARLGYLPFVYAASASIEMNRDIDFSGSHNWILILRAVPCRRTDVK